MSLKNISSPERAIDQHIQKTIVTTFCAAIILYSSVGITVIFLQSYSPVIKVSILYSSLIVTLLGFLLTSFSSSKKLADNDTSEIANFARKILEKRSRNFLTVSLFFTLASTIVVIPALLFSFQSFFNIFNGQVLQFQNTLNEFNLQSPLSPNTLLQIELSNQWISLPTGLGMFFIPVATLAFWACFTPKREGKVRKFMETFVPMIIGASSSILPVLLLIFGDQDKPLSLWLGDWVGVSLSFSLILVLTFIAGFYLFFDKSIMLNSIIKLFGKDELFPQDAQLKALVKSSLKTLGILTVSPALLVTSTWLSGTSPWSSLLCIIIVSTFQTWYANKYWNAMSKNHDSTFESLISNR